MRWYEAKVFALEEVKRDTVGTAVCEPVQTGTVLVRPAPWNTSEGEGDEGNAYECVRRTFMTKASHEAFADVAYIEVGCKRYEVKKLGYSLGMTLVVAELYKVGA